MWNHIGKLWCICGRNCQIYINTPPGLTTWIILVFSTNSHHHLIKWSVAKLVVSQGDRFKRKCSEISSYSFQHRYAKPRKYSVGQTLAMQLLNSPSRPTKLNYHHCTWPLALAYTIFFSQVYYVDLKKPVAHVTYKLVVTTICV